MRTTKDVCAKNTHELISMVQRLVNLVLGKYMPVVLGKSAYTTDKKIVIPPVGSLTEIFFLAMHELAHNFNNANVKGALVHKYQKLMHSFYNCFLDVCDERAFEKKFNGMVPYSAQFYAEYLRDENKMKYFTSATRKSGMVEYLHALTRYMILKQRCDELSEVISFDNKELENDYAAYIADMQPYIDAMRDWRDASKVAGIFMIRVEKLIADEATRRAQERKREQERQQQQQQERQQQQEEQDAKKNSEGGEPSDENDTAEQEAGEPSDKAENDASAGDVDENAPADDGNDTGGDPVSDNEEDGESDGPDGDGSSESVGGDTDESDTGSSSSNGSSSTGSDASDEASDNSAGSDSDTGEDARSSDDKADERKEDAESSEGDRSGEGDDTGNEEPESDPESDSDDDSSANEAGEKSDEQDDDSSTDADSDDDSGDGEGDEDIEASDEPVEEPLPELSDEELKEVQQKAEEDMASLNESEDSMNEVDEIRKGLDGEFIDSGEYVKSPDVVDIITEQSKCTESAALSFRDEGLRLLGPEVSKIVNLFVNNTKPHTIRYQRRGRLDIRRLNDPRDNLNIFTKKYPGTLEQSAVMLMVDYSCSMYRDGKATIASQLTSGLLYTLDKGAVPCAAFGYTDTDGKSSSPYERKHPIRIEVIKKFDEQYVSAMKRCHDSHCSCCTPDLDAMREYAVPQLLLRKEKSKVLFVICDGLPEVGNYVLTDRMRFSYKKYIRVVKSMGIKVFAFGIKTDVSAFFDNDWAYVNTDTLGQTLVDKLHEYLFRKD